MLSRQSAMGRVAAKCSVAPLLVLASTTVTVAEGDFVAIAEQMRQFVSAHQIAGAVTLVGHEGRIVHLVAVGAADREQHRPMSVDTMFRVMSMTKPITATAVMILADEGKLSIDDPVDKYLPAFADAKLKNGEPVQGLTIRHLLTHTSGLVGNQTCEESLEATAEMLAARPFGFQPGEKWEYGPSLNVCGRIIEVVSGQRYEDFLAKRIFEPLEMKDTTFVPTSEQRPRIAVVYEPSEDKKTLVPANRLPVDAAREAVPNPSGGLLSTAEDMFHFYQMILNGGELDEQRVVSADAVRAMTTVETGELPTGFTRGNGWGLGWCIVRQPAGTTGMLSAGTYGHGGYYGTQGWVDPQRKAIFVLLIGRAELSNSDDSEMRREFQRLAADALDAGQ
jgi:CubicO group peptidase (beta-lactamase class C family)